MTVHQAHFILPYFTNIPEDVVVNVWTFNWLIGSPAVGDFDNLRDNLVAFYDDVYADPGGPMLAPYVDETQARIKIYDLADPLPRVPVYNSLAPLNFANQASATGLPPEAAICLSFQGALVSGQPQARRRGRIFIGALAHMGAGSSVAFPNVTSGTRTSITGAAAAMKSAMAADDWAWSVWSKTDNAAVLVDNGWVDNAVDTQRRRGNTATARTLFT